MKSIGSITNIFPFIEEEERELVLKLVKESRNYRNFVEKLCDHVLSTDPSEIMVLLAYSHLENALNSNTSQIFLDRFPEHPVIRGDNIRHQMTDNIDWQVLLKVIGDEIVTNSNPLIQLNLYQQKWLCIRSSSIGTLEEDKIIKEMTDLINQNESLEPARARVLFLIASRYSVECDHRKSLHNYEAALQHALAHDDVVFGRIVQMHMAKLLSLTNPSKALEIIESVAETEKRFGYLNRSPSILGTMGLVFDARGEYSAAVRSYEESLEISTNQDPNLSLNLGPTAISRSFRRMGNLEESLEWAKIALTSKPTVSPRVQSIGVQVTANLNMSAALAMLGRIKEAKSHLDVGNELVFKSGSENWMSDVYLCRGLIERAEGDLPEALENFENAFEIIERLQRQGRMNECLFLLAETEIQLYTENPESDGLLSLHWISVMEEMAREKDLPGVLGLALLLRARMHFVEGQNDIAQATLSQVREISKEPGTRFLQEKIEMLTSTYNPKRH